MQPLCSAALAVPLWFRSKLQQGFALMGTKITGLGDETRAHSSKQMSWQWDEQGNSKGWCCSSQLGLSVCCFSLLIPNLCFSHSAAIAPQHLSLQSQHTFIL